MRLPPGSLAGLGQSLEKVVAVHVIQENVVSPIPSAHDVVHCAGVLDAQLVRHGMRTDQGCSGLSRGNALC